MSRAQTEVWLGFKAFDVHELLCHAIAAVGDFYAGQNILVRLIDTTFLPDDSLPENTMSVACGTALSSFLGGKRRKVVFVACDRPMFWLYGRPGISSLEQLNQARVATFPELAAPARFLQKMLGDVGVAPGLLPSRDDVARLGLLASGSVDAALLSSHYLPAEVAYAGVTQIAFMGDHVRLPSTGLAVTGKLYEEQPALVAAMVAIFQRAMKAVFDRDDTLLRRALTEYFGKPEHSLDPAIKVIRDCYNPFCNSYGNKLQPAIDAMAAGMGLASRDAGELYEFKYLAINN